MTEFIWQDRYLLGNQTVDQQHKRLFELANKLVESTSKDELTLQTMLLYQHVREHFRAEEEYMIKHGYPDYLQHVGTHNLMLDQLVNVSDKINKDEWHQQQVLIFMRAWISHILDEDSAINDYFQSNP